MLSGARPAGDRRRRRAAAGGDRRSACEPFETFSEDHESLSTAFYGESRILKIDPDGRVVLPEEFRAYAGIADTAVFVGQGFKFQIWEPQRFAERAARDALASPSR